MDRFQVVRKRISASRKYQVYTRVTASSSGANVQNARRAHNKPSALVVGAGPAGLASALMLAKRGWEDIVVVEKQSGVETYDPALGYLYLIDGRGQRFTDLIGLTDELAQAGVLNTSLNFALIGPDGKRQTFPAPSAVTKRRPAYWIPRHVLLSLLYREVVRNWSHRISIIFDVASVAMTRDDTHAIQVSVRQKPAVRTAEPMPLCGKNTCEDDSKNCEGEEEVVYEPSLILGCDGLNSVVRTTLASWDPPGLPRFRMHLMPSHSTGLRFKVLRVQPSFAVDKEGREPAAPGVVYMFHGKYSDRTRNLMLPTMAPPRDPQEPRTAVLTTYPDNVLWDIEDPGVMREHLQGAFPQLSLGSVVSEEELERFTRSRGGFFPAPQYCEAMQLMLPPSPPSNKAAASSPATERFATASLVGGSAETGEDAAPILASARGSMDLLDADGLSEGMPGGLPARRVGVVLLGDALHCFPPDLGQGVNSALEDVVVLNEALSETNDDVARALPLFEEKRMPDVKALVRLVQIGSPWQYWQDKFRKNLWNIGFGVKLLLSKRLPFLFDPPIVKLIQDEKLRYRDILAMDKRNNVRYLALIGVLVAAVVALLARR
eukprot:jgi/Mesvir1/14800/Mv05438-RA.1